MEGFKPVPLTVNFVKPTKPRKYTEHIGTTCYNWAAGLNLRLIIKRKNVPPRVPINGANFTVR